MMLDTIELASGVIVTLQSIYITETNDGLHGDVTSVTNRWELEASRADAQKLWPDIPVQVILPDPPDELPPVRSLGLLESTSRSHFEFVVVLFFQTTPFPFVSELNKEKIRNLHWKAIAEERSRYPT